jgi:hypothetical protein
VIVEHDVLPSLPGTMLMEVAADPVTSETVVKQFERIDVLNRE